MAALALVVATALAAGCSGDKNTAKQTLHPLVPKEQVSSIAKQGNDYLVAWAGVLVNPNRWHFGENLSALISARDAAGREVVHFEQSLDAIAPSGSLAFSGTATTATRPVNVKISYRPVTWRHVARIPSAFKPFEVSEVHTEKLKNGAYLVTGYVSDPFRKAVGSLTVTALLHDQNGKLLGGDGDFVDNIDPGARRRFVITVDGVKAPVAGDKTRVYASTWGSTARTYQELALAGAVPVNTVKPKTPPFSKE
jgi:hypothetical protein